MAKKEQTKKGGTATQEPPWQELALGGVMTEAGSARKYKTGDWRTERPVWDPEKCIHCLYCWMFCPDSAILVEDGKVVGIDYDFCKGCGICAKECPDRASALEMKPESDFH